MDVGGRGRALAQARRFAWRDSRLAPLQQARRRAEHAALSAAPEAAARAAPAAHGAPRILEGRGALFRPDS